METLIDYCNQNLPFENEEHVGEDPEVQKIPQNRAFDRSRVPLLTQAIKVLLKSHGVFTNAGVVDDFVQRLLSPIQSRTIHTQTETSHVEK